MKEVILKWAWRIARFPFVLAIWVVGCVIAGVTAACDWLINPDKWNGINRKGDK